MFSVPPNLKSNCERERSLRRRELNLAQVEALLARREHVAGLQGNGWSLSRVRKCLLRSVQCEKVSRLIHPTVKSGQSLPCCPLTCQRVLLRSARTSSRARQTAKCSDSGQTLNRLLILLEVFNTFWTFLHGFEVIYRATLRPCSETMRTH